MTLLKDKLVLFLPYEDRNGEELDVERMHAAFHEYMLPIIQAAGGATCVNAEGIWINGKGETHSETVQLHTVFCSLEDIGGLDWVQGRMLLLKEALYQESVAFECNGQLYLL